jgi:hypothetical protein
MAKVDANKLASLIRISTHPADQPDFVSERLAHGVLIGRQSCEPTDEWGEEARLKVA